MSTLKCKMCGGTIDFEQGTTVITCEYCGTKQTLPRLDDDRKANLYDRANHFRRNNEYDKAMSIYEQILNEDNTDAESYWSIVLCKYGIEYVEDPATHKRVPTVNRAQFTSVIADEDYKKALEYADIEQKIIYEAEAKAIDEIQKGILEISQKEEPFDVFICYKETDSNGRRTQDSVLANDLYHQLTQEGFKVFFSRITLEDKLGTAYEPYIFAALNSAKVMVVLGTKAEFFNAVWVKNEWSRYLALIRKGEKKMLIPAYRDMDPYDLPEEFSHLQAQDMSKLGFMQDLIRGIKKIIGDSQPKAAAQTVVNNNYSSNVSALLKRGKMQLEDGEWEKADEFYEEVLNQDAECAEAFLGKFFAANKVQGLEEYKKHLLDQTSVVEPNNETIEKEDKDHIESMVDSCTVNGYLEPGAIRKMYEYDRTHEITTPIRVKQKESVLSELNNDRLFSRASKFAQDTTKESIDSFVARLTEQLDNRIEQARTSDAQNVTAAEEAYAVFISDTDTKVLNTCESEKAKKQKDYKAVVEKGRTCKTSVECESAIKSLGAFAGYEDADAVIEELNSRCKELKEAEEKAQKKKKNKTRNIVIIVASIIMIAVAVVLTFTVFIPNSKYNSAIALMNEGNYEEAIVAFTELNGYKDSSSKIDACKESILQGKYNSALALFDNKEYEQAITAFEELGDYLDSPEKVLESKYQIAVLLMNNKQYDEAMEAFSVLGDYSNSAEMIELCSESKDAYVIYNDALEYINANLYEEALSLFESISFYCDSEEKADECKNALYDNAVSLISNGQYAEADEILRDLGDYSDSITLRRNHTVDVIRSSDLRVGDTVILGDYDYADNYSYEGDTKCNRWRILAISGSQILLLNTSCVDRAFFDVNSSDWNQSSIKQWLNGTFMSEAFSPQEQSIIVDKGYGKVFLLSVEEANSYSFGNARFCGQNIDWWLRTPGHSMYYGYIYTTTNEIREWDIYSGAWALGDGSAYRSGDRIYYTDNSGSTSVYDHPEIYMHGVRPAIWIDISN